MKLFLLIVLLLHMHRCLLHHSGGIPNPNPNRWEARVKNPGAPPLKTDEEWLLFYHGLSKREPRKYKIGVILLDLDKPEEVLYVSSFPVIEPDQIYEYSGFKPGVTYTLWCSRYVCIRCSCTSR